MHTFQQVMAEARSHFDRKDYRQASDHYLRALNLPVNDEDRAVVWSELSVTFYRMNAWERAIEAAENVLSYNPEYAAREDLYRIMGFSCQSLGKDEEAQIFLEKSVQIDAHSEKQVLAVYELAKLCFKKQAYPEARKWFDHIEARLYKDYREYWQSLLFFQGFIHYYTNDLEAGKEAFSRILNHTRDARRIASAMFGLAFIAFAEKDYLKTINLSESVMVNDPDFFDKETLGFLTAASFYNLGRTDVFDTYYEQLIMTYPAGRYVKELKAMKERGTPEL